MRLGVAIEDSWSFFQEIYDELQAHHDTRLFSRRSSSLPALNARVNRRLFDRDLRSFLAQNDVVFFEWSSQLLAAASHLPKTCGIVTRLHRFEMYRWADKVNWDAVDRVILVSEAKRQEFAARFPAQAGKLVVIPEAVALPRFDFSPRPFGGQLGTLCHLKPRKRVYELILAFSELADAYGIGGSEERRGRGAEGRTGGSRGGGLHLHIGGGRATGFEEYTEALTSLVRRLHLEERVTFHGNVTEPQEWYRNIDIFISNSYSEGLQLAPMEAMACGCYTLSHWWEGVEELLPPEQLYFTDRQLQHRVLDYCRLSPAGQRERQEAQRRTVEERFDLDRITSQIRELVEAVAAQRGEQVQAAR